MWHWIKRWHDWTMNEALPLYRLRSRSRGLHVSYEKCGLTLHHDGIPWNAEGVVVEASLRLPPGVNSKTEFRLHLEGREPFAPVLISPAEGDECHRFFFHLPVPGHDTTAELHWRTHKLGEAPLRLIGEEQYREGIRLDTPTVFVRVGDKNVAAQTFVSTQCRGMHAVARLRSPHGLAPLADLGLRVRFRCERVGVNQEVPVCLSATQLAAKEAMISVSPGSVPKRVGNWSVEWLLGDQVLFSRGLRAISLKTFLRSLIVRETRFLIEKGGSVELRRNVPDLDQIDRVGPCFVLGSREAGIAARCELQILAQVPGAVGDPMLSRQDVLVTDGPTVFAPGTIEPEEAHRLTAFELRHRETTLGTLSLRPIPEATFTTEGGFKTPAAFNWSNLAEEELRERLNRLLG